MVDVVPRGKHHYEPSLRCVVSARRLGLGRTEQFRRTWLDPLPHDHNLPRVRGSAE